MDATILTAALVASLATAGGNTPPPAAATLAPPQVHQTEERDVRVLEASFTVNASRAVAWSVLTDYAGLPHFVPAMRRCTVRERKGSELLVEQEAAASFLFFSRSVNVLLQIHEDAPNELSFRDVGRKDFSLYEGAWTLSESQSGLEVKYRLRALPKGAVPSFVAGSAARRSAEQLLAQVRAEMLRRTNTEPQNGPAAEPALAETRETP